MLITRVVGLLYLDSRFALSGISEWNYFLIYLRRSHLLPSVNTTVLMETEPTAAADDVVPIVEQECNGKKTCEASFKRLNGVFLRGFSLNSVNSANHDKIQKWYDCQEYNLNGNKYIKGGGNKKHIFITTFGWYCHWLYWIDIYPDASRNFHSYKNICKCICR